MQLHGATSAPLSETLHRKRRWYKSKSHQKAYKQSMDLAARKTHLWRSLNRHRLGGFEPHLVRGRFVEPGGDPRRTRDRPDDHTTEVERRRTRRKRRVQEPRSLGDLRLSRVTKRIDNFLSHDWQTAGWLKALTLVVLFNSRAAAIAT
eukprot:g28500.t1